MLYTLRFFFSLKCSLFHNANLFGSCIIHILCTGVLKFKKNNSGAKGLITLDNKFQKGFCVCDEYIINLFVCVYEVRNGTFKKKILFFCFKIMLRYDILRNRLKHYTERCFK